MAVNGPATEDGLLSQQTWQVLESDEPMMVPVVWSPETDEVMREPTIIQVRYPERPL